MTCLPCFSMTLWSHYILTEMCMDSSVVLDLTTKIDLLDSLLTLFLWPCDLTTKIDLLDILLTLFLWPCHLTTKIDLLDSLLTLFLWPYDLIIPTYFIDDLLSFVTDVVREQVVTVPHQFQHLIMVLGPLSRVLKWHRSNQHMHYIRYRLFMSLHALGSSAIKMRHKSSLLYTV